MIDSKLRQFTKSLSDTLLGLRPLGGSECFMRVGEDFYADYRYFGLVIEEQRNSLDELRRSEVRQQREIALLRAAQEWQDISTAPTDGRISYFYLDWADDCARLNEPLAPDAPERFFRGKWRCWGSVYKATHWQPCLAPSSAPATLTAGECHD